ncbi:MAG TPA: PKD domain-containing protein [Flavobacteriales bacterium]|nr:PKD domain-containing protein [Flavobacteriales bacterium]
MSKIIFGLLFMAFSAEAWATHLIGSEMYYVDLGGGNYQITLKVYRECGPANTQGTDFDDIIYLGIFYSGTNQLQQVEDVFLNFNTVQNIPVIMTNPCGTPPPDLCVEEATYTKTLMLGATALGYEIAWQRCCRNPSISNVQNAGGTDNPGMTATVHIPGTNATNGDNSSPVFQAFPPVALCADFGFFFDHAAIDPDGDQLVYSLCAPFDGGGPNGAGGGFGSPAPNPPSNPPYTPIPYGGGFSSAFPIAANPAFVINPATGFITGTPTIPGQYAMGICVEEFRNGVSLGKVIRDFQFNVALCDANIVAAVTPQQPEQLCMGETIQFENNSTNGDNFLWDFGVNGINTDISELFEPEYTFPDTGTYVVTLIANPTWPCADTSSQVFDVFMPLSPVIIMDDFDCISGVETFGFDVDGTMSGAATYFWDLTGGSPSSANITSPQGVAFANANTWGITLTVNNHGCTVNVDFDWVAPEDPVASIEDQTGFCQGLTFTFANNSTNAETYLWDFGSPFGGDSSTDLEPQYTYADSGSYTVSLIAYAPFTCPSSATATVDIHYLLSPIFQAPDPNCFSSHNFSMTGSASIDINTIYSWDFGGEVSSAITNGTTVSNLVYAEPGVYDVTLTSEVPGLEGCQQSFTAQVEAIPDPTIDFTGGPLTGCPPHQVSFTNGSSTSTATTYLWHFGDGTTSNSIHPVHVYLYSGDFPVLLEMTTGGFCAKNLDKFELDFVQTFPIPFAAFEVDPNVVDILAPIVTVDYLGDQEVDCFYNFGDGGSLQDCDGTYIYSDGGNFNITLTVINEVGCTNTASGEVSISGSVFYAPNTFTPDGDGINDVWLPVVLGVSAYRMRIVNRWGELVWETLDASIPWLGQKGIDGQHFCPNGMYVWEAVWVDQIGYPRTKSGTVFLRR